MEQLIKAIKTRVTGLFWLHFISYSAGLTAVILLLLFVQHDLSYDNYQPDKARVYRAHVDYSSFGFDTLMPIRSLSVAQTLQNDADVEGVFGLIPAEFMGYEGQPFDYDVRVGATQFKLKEVYFASDNLTDFIDLDVLHGDLGAVLSAPNKLAISESEAHRLFSQSNVIGKQLTTKDKIYLVGAVFKDLPMNTHFKFSVLSGFPTTMKEPPFGYVYIKTAPNTDITQLENKFFKAYLQTKSKEHQSVEYRLLNISDIHLKGRSTYEMKPLGSITAVAIACGLIVIIFLQITCNFINCNLVSVGKSAKQIAIKKAIGASRGHLFSVFIGESIVLTGAAVVLALAGVELAYGYFNQLVETHITFTLTTNVALLALAFSLVIGFINGVYASLVAANVDVTLLARTHYRYHLSVLVKSILCFQAGLAIFIFVVFVVAQLQMSYILNKEVGYELDNRLIIKQIPTDHLFDKAHPHLINALGKLPGVNSVTATDINLTEQVRGGVTLTWPNGQVVPGVSPSVTSHFNVVETLGLTLLAGRDFSQQYQHDWHKTLPDGTKSMAIIVTESMVRAAGYVSVQQVIGMTLSNGEEQLNATVVGVVADIKVGSVQHEATPLSFNLARHYMPHGNVVIKAHADTAMTELKAQITTLLQSRFSMLDSEVSTMADDYAKNYKNELKIITISKWLLVLSSLLTLISLAVLVSQTVITQQKNLAIKKVLGAPITQLVTGLSWSYLKLVSVSLLISLPLAYWLVGNWLHNFNDRITQPFWVYAIAAITVTTITWLTVACLAYKSASARPALMLKEE